MIPGIQAEHYDRQDAMDVVREDKEKECFKEWYATLPKIIHSVDVVGGIKDVDDLTKALQQDYLFFKKEWMEDNNGY